MFDVKFLTQHFSKVGTVYIYDYRKWRTCNRTAIVMTETNFRFKCAHVPVVQPSMGNYIQLSARCQREWLCLFT